jgi:hypothetical protein
MNVARRGGREPLERQIMGEAPMPLTNARAFHQLSRLEGPA